MSEPSRRSVEKLFCWILPPIFGLISLGQGPHISISNEFSDNADAAGPGTLLRQTLSCKATVSTGMIDITVIELYQYPCHLRFMHIGFTKLEESRGIINFIFSLFQTFNSINLTL